MIQQVRVVSGAAATRLLVIIWQWRKLPPCKTLTALTAVLFAEFHAVRRELFSGAAVLDGCHFMLYSGAHGRGGGRAI
jgi:hypothetical protein